MSSHLIIRADADVAMGTGHVMRCLTLAEAWLALGRSVTFVSHCPSEPLANRIRELVDDFVALGVRDDIESFVQRIGRCPEAVVVLDGYHFGAEEQRAFKSLGNPLLVFDDYVHADHYFADLVVNQSQGAEGLAYSCEPYTRLLLGPRFVLLRAEFDRWKTWQREIPNTARRLLVTLGGSDPDNRTEDVVRAIEGIDIAGFETIVVCGGSNPNTSAVCRRAERLTPPVRVECGVSSMSDLMAWADLAVSAGGTTCWELAFMGLPNLILVLADNQLGIARGLDTARVSRGLGWAESLSEDTLRAAILSLAHDPASRASMSEKGRALVDGEGTRRVIEAIEGLLSCNN